MQDLATSQSSGQETFHQLTQFKNRCEKQEIEINSVRQQLKDVKEESERRIAAMNRRNLDLESDMNKLDSQYKLLNDKSGKLSQQDQELRKL